MPGSDFDVVTGFGVKPGPFVPSRVPRGLLEGRHGFVLVGRLETRVFDVHPVEPFMAVAVQRPPTLLLALAMLPRQTSNTSLVGLMPVFP